MKTLFRRSMILLLASKSLSLCSPFFLKMTVNALAMAQSVDLTTACLGIGAFGLSKVLSSAFGELRMNMITQIIQTGSQKVAMMSFTHLHSLDLYFHRVSAKNTVFAIHRALKSIESGLRFSLGFFSPVVAEFVLLCGML